jgi:predicted Zn-dependent peptidase
VRSYFTDIALWSIYAGSRAALVPRLLDALEQELKSLIRRPPQQEEIEDTKGHLLGTMIMSREDIESRQKRLLRQYLLTGKVLEYEQSMSYLETVTPKEVEQTIQKILAPNKFNLLVYGCENLQELTQSGFTL